MERSRGFVDWSANVANAPAMQPETPVKLAMFTKGGGSPSAGVVLGDRIVPMGAMEGSLPDTVLDLLRGDPSLLARIEKAAASAKGYLLSEVSLEAPIPRPGKILAIGGNYYSHLEELRRVPSLAHLANIERQIWFNKQTTAVTGPYAEIQLPEQSQNVDFEVELAMVIGTVCRAASRHDALDHVAGYMVANDLSARDVQMNADISLAKSFDGFSPMGPWITTSDELPNPQRLLLRSILNGEVRQQESTADMVYDCRDQIAYLSNYVTLEPGDILLTGTPAGVGALADPPRALQSGDRLRCEIEGIGAIESVFRRA